MNVSARHALGTTAVEVTALGLGTNPLGGIFAEVAPEEAVATIQACYEEGIRLFDTAPVYGYGNAERALGAALRNLPRDECVVTTKVGRLLLTEGPSEREDTMVVFEGVPFYKSTERVRPYFDFTYDGANRSLEASLDRLGLDRVDAVYIHDPDAHFEEAMEGAYRALHDLRGQGVVGAIGVGVNQWEILVRFAEEGDFDCFLLAGRYTLLDQSALDVLLPICEERRISIVCGGAFNSGILATDEPRSVVEETSRDASKMQAWTAGSTFDYVPAAPEWVEKAQMLADACGRHGVPLRAAALQFPLAHPAIATVVMGPRSVQEARENIAAFTLDIPSELWSELAVNDLIARDAPTPVSA